MVTITLNGIRDQIYNQYGSDPNSDPIQHYQDYFSKRETGQDQGLKQKVEEYETELKRKDDFYKVQLENMRKQIEENQRNKDYEIQNLRAQNQYMPPPQQYMPQQPLYQTQEISGLHVLLSFIFEVFNY